MRTELIEILSKILGVAADTIDAQSSPDSISSWDSLTHLELVAAIEQRFSIQLNMREIQTMDTVQSIEAILDAHNVTVA